MLVLLVSTRLFVCLYVHHLFVRLLVQIVRRACLFACLSSPPQCVIGVLDLFVCSCVRVVCVCLLDCLCCGLLVFLIVCVSACLVWLFVFACLFVLLVVCALLCSFV